MVAFSTLSPENKEEKATWAVLMPPKPVRKTHRDIYLYGKTLQHTLQLKLLTATLIAAAAAFEIDRGAVKLSKPRTGQNATLL